MASYLPVSATRGATTPDGRILPWFRGTWAANGQALVDGAEVILENPRFREAASRLFDTTEVTPNTVVVNVNAPMPAGAVHVDIPSFRGATRDRYPIQLLQAMGSSCLFEPWRIVEAGAVVWFYDGPGGAYDYWPEGLSGPMRSECPPFSNRALVADIDRNGWPTSARIKRPKSSEPADRRPISNHTGDYAQFSNRPSCGRGMDHPRSRPARRELFRRGSPHLHSMEGPR
jgi:hypothetical protein